MLTLRAKSLAKADPGLGLYGSIAAATHQHQQQRRRHAIAHVLHRKIRAAVDKDTAAIAVAVYDLDQIAHQVAASADYQTLTALIAADLQPLQLSAYLDPNRGIECTGATQLSPVRTRAFPTQMGGATIKGAASPEPSSNALRRHRSATPPHAAAGSTARHQSSPAPVLADPLPVDDANLQTAVAVETDHTPAVRDGAADAVPTQTGAAVAYWYRRDPGLRPAAIAALIGRSERTVRRHWPPSE